MVAEANENDLAATAEHLDWPSTRVEQALAYADAFPSEAASILARNQQMSWKDVKAMLPPGMFVESTSG